MKLLTIANAKTIKGESLGYLTGILYLSPHKLSGVNLCPNATPGCIKSCLYTAGRGAFKSIQDARMIKTIHWLENPQGFIEQLHDDINALIKLAAKTGLKPAVRLNGTSDIDWTLTGIMSKFPSVQFYDYTKVKSRLYTNAHANYQLTYSASELTTREEINKLIADGHNVALVTKDKSLYNSAFSVDGNDHDLRFLDGKGKIVLLKPIGRAKKDNRGFVYDNN